MAYSCSVSLPYTIFNMKPEIFSEKSYLSSLLIFDRKKDFKYLYSGQSIPKEKTRAEKKKLD